MTLRELLGITFYYWYGSGGHQSLGKQPLSVSGQDLINADGKWVSTIRATHNFKLHRAFVDSWTIVPETTSTNQSFTLKMNPTEQNFWLDEYFKLMKANGIKNICNPTGLFDWLKVEGFSQRKSACYDHSKDPNDPTAWADFAHLFRLLATYYKDKDFKPEYYQCGNEKDFRWNVQHILTPTEMAVCDWECIKAIYDVDPTQKIIVGCTLTPTIETFNEWWASLQQCAARDGRRIPVEVLVYMFNHYVRDQGGNQGGGLADTPESQLTQTYGFYSALNTACKSIGMKWGAGEYGYSTSTSTSFAALKQKAPALQGVSHEDAQGVLIFRTLLMFASFSECIGATFYHTKDGYEAEPFTYIGANYDKDFGGKEDWSSKPGKIFLEQMLEKYGDYEVYGYYPNSKFFEVVITNGQEDKLLIWSDKQNYFDVVSGLTITPVPTETTIEPPTDTNMELKVINKKLNVFLTHFDSPESRLLNGYEAAFSQEIKDLAPIGNCITATLRGDDVAVNPWISNNVANGVDFAKIRKWKGQLLEWITERRKYVDDPVLILYLGERTNWNNLTDAQYDDFIEAIGQVFKEGTDITGNCIFGWEEIGQSSTGAQVAAFVNNMAAKIKGYMPKALVMIHNNPGQKHWQTPMAADIICLQETSLSAFNTSAQDVFNRGYAVHLHEYYNPISSGALTDAKKKIINDYTTTSFDIVSGYGLYIQGYDTVQPSNVNLDTQKYFAQAINDEPVFGCTDPTASNYNPAATVDDGTCIFNPNPNNMLFISNQNNHPATAPVLTEGMNVPAGSYSVFSNVAGKFDLYKEGVRVPHNGSATYFPHTENGTPFDMIGSTGANANMFNFTQGNWRLIFTPNSGAVQTVNFTVGVVVPPVVLGCTDPRATNYNPLATQDDGSCVYPADVIVNVPVTIKVTKKPNGTVEIEIPKFSA